MEQLLWGELGDYDPAAFKEKRNGWNLRRWPLEQEQCAGIRAQLRKRIMEELDERRQIEDQELFELIDRSIRDMGRRAFFP